MLVSCGPSEGACAHIVSVRPTRAVMTIDARGRSMISMIISILMPQSRIRDERAGRRRGGNVVLDPIARNDSRGSGERQPAGVVGWPPFAEEGLHRARRLDFGRA